MPYPKDIGVVDTLIGLPPVERRSWYESFKVVLHDEGSKEFAHPAGYMFTEPPVVPRTDDSAGELLRQMDRHNIEYGLVPISFADEMTVEAVRAHPDRLLGSIQIDPNDVMGAIRDMRRAVDEVGAIAAQFMPAGVFPFVPIDDPKAYAVYAACVDLDIPIFVNGGIPGPRVPAASQHPGLVDVVCYDFPDLRFVFRHCCEPWVDLTVKLMLKWPNLYYSTTAFAPRYYPEAIIRYANTRGADKIIYGGYYPMGLELDRIFAELPQLELKDEVWPKFLRDNALRVLKVKP